MRIGRVKAIHHIEPVELNDNQPNEQVEHDQVEHEQERADA